MSEGILFFVGALPKLKSLEFLFSFCFLFAEFKFESRSRKTNKQQIKYSKKAEEKLKAQLSNQNAHQFALKNGFMQDIAEQRIYCAEQIFVPDDLPLIMKNF